MEQGSRARGTLSLGRHAGSRLLSGSHQCLELPVTAEWREGRIVPEMQLEVQVSRQWVLM